MSEFLSYSFLSPSYYSFVSRLSTVAIPQGWTEAMIKEMDALKRNNTSNFVSLPRGKLVVGCGTF